MKFEIMVAIRFLRESKVQTVLIMAGIIIGVSVQVFLSALIGGLQTDIVNSTVGDAPHITLSASENRPFSFLTEQEERKVITSVTQSRTRRNIISYNDLLTQLRSDSRLSAVSASVNQQAFVTSGGVQSTVAVRGIEFEDGDRIYRIGERLLQNNGSLSGNNIFIGIGLSEDSGLDLNSILEMQNSQGASSFFRIAGIFDFENQQANETLVFMSLSSAQSFFDMSGMISQIEMQVPEVFDALPVANSLSEQFSAYEVVSWQETNQQLLSALQSQSGSSFVIQFFVILAITLGIASVLAINVVQKSRQIGILKAMGATGNMASRIFVFQGVLLGFIGSIFGVFSGYLLIQGFVAGTSSVTGDPLFPIEISITILIVSIIVATTASTIAAAIPARKAAVLDPIEVIRNG